MKKIAHIFNSIEYSGAERMIFTLKDFYTSHYIPYAISTGRDAGAFYAEFSRHFITRHLPVSEKRNFGYVRDFFKLINFYKKEKIDILHIHPSRRFLFHVLAAKIAGVKKVVRQVHNNFNFSGVVHLKEKIGRKIAISLGVTIIAISKSVHQTEKERFKIKTTLINNFFDEDRIFPGSEEEKKSARKQLGIPEESFCIISIGSCIERKQHVDIIKAIKNLQVDIANIFYLHLGDGILCTAEKQLVKDLQIEDHVLYAGNQNNVRTYLIASDLYVITSQYEGIGIATIEAMAAGIACLMYDTPGSHELGADDAPGLLIDTTVNALTQKIKYIKEHPDERKKIGSLSSHFALNEYSKKRAIKEWTNIYSY